MTPLQDGKVRIWGTSEYVEGFEEGALAHVYADSGEPGSFEDALFFMAEDAIVLLLYGREPGASTCSVVPLVLEPAGHRNVSLASKLNAAWRKHRREGVRWDTDEGRSIHALLKAGEDT